MSPPKRILVIDDSPLILAAATHALAQAGYEVETRSTIDQVDDGPLDGFDLVLMDVQMPELYGDDVAMVLRFRGRLTAPVYLFSTLDDADLAARAAEAGLDGFISKQTGIEHVVKEVRRILGA